MSIIRNSEVVKYSGAAIIHVYTLYIWIHHLVHTAVSVNFGRCPLLGVSVNRESTVDVNCNNQFVHVNAPFTFADITEDSC